MALYSNAVPTKNNGAPTLSKVTERFTFFYSTSSPFSQFHPSIFKASPLFLETAGEYTFTCAEQWMMLNKAQLFKDHDIAEKIMKSPYNPSYYKQLGREVKNFDEAVWKQHNCRIVHNGNKHKFSQNPKLLAELLATEGTTLVEASPRDKIYGIGLSSTDRRAFSRKTWLGTNLLGETLTAVRNELKPV